MIAFTRMWLWKISGWMFCTSMLLKWYKKFCLIEMSPENETGNLFQIICDDLNIYPFINWYLWLIIVLNSSLSHIFVTETTEKVSCVLFYYRGWRSLSQLMNEGVEKISEKQLETAKSLPQRNEPCVYSMSSVSWYHLFWGMTVISLREDEIFLKTYFFIECCMFWL